MLQRLDFGSERPARRAGESFDRSPLLVFYELTQACDLVCQHCRACANQRSDPGELSTEYSQQLIDQIAEFPQRPMLILTGGDPLKRDDIFELIEYAVESGIRVSITPSATQLVTREAIAQLRDAGISRMAISIDGADATTHDGVRGVAGSYQRSLEILGDASDLGIETQINTVLSPANVDQIEPMADLFAELGISMWSAFFLVPVGRAESILRLTGHQCEGAFERLWLESEKQPYLIKTTEAPHYRRFATMRRVAARRAQSGPPPKHFLTAGLNDGKGVMFVSHTGLIYPSGFLPVVAGVFPFQHVVSVYQHSNVFRSLRDSNNLKGKCGQCEYRNLCGGSRARAFAVSGNLFAEEPDCIYKPRGGEPVQAAM